MQMSDVIADMLTRIRNASNAKHDTVDVPASNMKKAIADILLDEGYIKGVQVIEDGKQGVIRITLKYEAGKQKAIHGIRRVSKPGLRIYSNYEDMPRVLFRTRSERSPHLELRGGNGAPMDMGGTLVLPLEWRRGCRGIP